MFSIRRGSRRPSLLGHENIAVAQERDVHLRLAGLQLGQLLGVGAEVVDLDLDPVLLFKGLGNVFFDGLGIGPAKRIHDQDPPDFLVGGQG